MCVVSTTTGSDFYTFTVIKFVHYKKKIVAFIPRDPYLPEVGL